jgi:hypothetical protein
MLADVIPSCSECARRTYTDWLKKLKTGDTVLVRNNALHFRGVVSSSTERYVLLDNLKFRRCDGWLVGHWRNKNTLRLVRTQEDQRS